VVLTDWIVAETGNGSARSQDRRQFSEAAKTTIKDPRVELVVIDNELLQRALGFVSKRDPPISRTALAAGLAAKPWASALRLTVLRRSLDFFAQHADKSWGLVDCASFLVMRDRGISVAFTSDQHFEQAGFTRLLSV
jgi:predicted nucleic acid-binding protein